MQLFLEQVAALECCQARVYGATVACTMSKKAHTLQSIRDRLPNVFERRTSSLLKDSPTSSSGPSEIWQASGSTFGLLVDGMDPPQTSAREASDIAYKGIKGLLDVLDRVGYALPPLKAAAAGLSSVLEVIDVRTSSQQVSVLD